MIHKNSKFINFFLGLFILFTAVSFYSYNISYADHCVCDENGCDPFDSSCHICANGEVWPACLSTTTVYFCPDTTTQQACQAINPPGTTCVEDTSQCPPYDYCNLSTGSPDNYDPGGLECTRAHPHSLCLGSSAACTYAPVSYCSDPEASNYSTQDDCETWNNPHKCNANNSVCAYNCTGNGCTEVSYCPTAGFIETDINGVSCEATKPSGATCVANINMCLRPIVTQPSTCEITASVTATCSSTYSYTGTFKYSYTYTPPATCSSSVQSATLTSIQNYLEGQICGGSGTPPPVNNVDWCPNMAGVQTNPSDCLDQCTNISLIQLTVPTGMTRNSDGTCHLTSSDVCPNITGIQASVPEGYYKDEFGDCLAMQDICPDIPGDQYELPSGYCFDFNGYCVPEYDINGNQNQCRQDGASCGTAAGTMISSGASVNGATACSQGAFMGYVAFDSNTNIYNWNCYGGRGTSASCYANKGPVCGDATMYTWKMDERPPGSFSNLCASGNTSTVPKLTVTDNTNGGAGVFNWDCKMSSLKTSCTAEALNCSLGMTYFPRCGCAFVCPDVPVDLVPKLKTTEVINKDQPCRVFLDQTISDENVSTLCVLKNVTNNTIPLLDFKPGDESEYDTYISRDTTFKLTCGDDATDTGTVGVLDANEVLATSEGSCRLNLKSTEFN